MKVKRRRSKVLIAVFAALLIGIAALCYSQRGNLQALVMSLQYSEEELAALQQQSLDDLLKEYGLDPLPQIGGEETPASDSVPEADASVSQEGEEAPPLPTIPGTAAKLPESDIPSKGHTASSAKESESDRSNLLPKDEKKDKKDKSNALPKDVQNLVYSLYSLQSQYFGKLEGLAASTRSRFDALPPEQRNNATRASMVKTTLSQAISLENQCDGRVSSILQELRAALKKHGLDASVATNAENYYATQKGLIKAEYMRKYNKYLK